MIAVTTAPVLWPFIVMIGALAIAAIFDSIYCRALQDRMPVRISKRWSFNMKMVSG